MRQYCLNNDKCRRQVLLQDFDHVDDEAVSPSPLCKCCDVCAKSCRCDACSI